MHDLEREPLASRRNVCAYCRAVLPEEPEERRRVFQHTGDQPVFWLVYRCVNEACQRRTFVVDTSLTPPEKRKTSSEEEWKRS